LKSQRKVFFPRLKTKFQKDKIKCKHGTWDISRQRIFKH
jgi:hypothetical protein